MIRVTLRRAPARRDVGWCRWWAGPLVVIGEVSAVFEPDGLECVGVNHSRDEQDERFVAMVTDRVDRDAVAEMAVPGWMVRRASCKRFARVRR